MTGVIAFLFGAVVGSFLNVCADRLPEGQSLLRPPSHCPACGRPLSPLDMVPVVSYLALRGKCRSCAAPIPPRVLVMEIATGLLFTYIWITSGWSLDTLLLALAGSILLLVAAIDLERQLVLNSVLALGLPMGLVSAPLWSADVWQPLWSVGNAPLGALLDAITAGIVGLVVFLIVVLVSRGGMGLGDVKLAAVVGIWVGLRGLAVALFVAAVSGGVVALLLLAMRVKGRKDRIPFAPFLALGGMSALLWGQELSARYLELMTRAGP
ncbi:MAG: leader peptidase (prepilin peptidase) / N-methyltransferase [Dehalococcoidia bacterium]|nr:leader peptidase (prepilin peptidase) / N-methyltransferase [Dehalococcoidia bacterium]